MRVAVHDELPLRQCQVLRFIERRIAEGCPPTVREIRDHLGVASTFGVHCHLNALERKGLIHRVPDQARNIRLGRKP